MIHVTINLLFDLNVSQHCILSRDQLETFHAWLFLGATDAQTRTTRAMHQSATSTVPITSTTRVLQTSRKATKNCFFFDDVCSLHATHRSSAVLCNCVRSLKHQQPSCVIVVRQGSGRDTRGHARSRQYFTSNHTVLKYWTFSIFRCHSLLLGQPWYT